MDENRLEVYYDHYKESLLLSKEAQTRRNKSFVILCFLEVLSLLILARPESAFGIINIGVSSKIGEKIMLSNEIIQSLIWVLIAYVTIRYCQDTIYVERSYSYLECLEKKISQLLKDNLFSREGENYRNNYPAVLNLIDLFYKTLMPIICFMINLFHIVEEWRNRKTVGGAIVCDTIVFVALSLIILAFFFQRHRGITKWCRKHVPLFNTITEIVHGLLKRV